MIKSQSIALPNPAGFLDLRNRMTIIRLRWLVVIVSSYLLVTSPATWLNPSSIHSLILFYILTNIALYLVEEKLFDSVYFYAPLAVLDTLFVTFSLVICRQLITDFYIAPLVIAALLLSVGILFYGYFTRILRSERRLKDQDEAEDRDMAMIHSLCQSLTSSLNRTQILETAREKINNVVHGGVKLYILLVGETRDSSHTTLCWGDEGEASLPREVDLCRYPIVQQCLLKRRAVIHQNGGSEPAFEGQGGFKDLSVGTAIAVPIALGDESHGAIFLLFDDGDRVLSSKEIHFFRMVAFATAIALSNAKKYEGLQADAQARQVIAEELAEASRLKSDFLANTSHELRTPITTILGYGQLLLDNFCGPLTGEQSKSIERLMENAEGLLRLVEDLLDYSRLKRGETGLSMRQQDVRCLIEELRGELAPLERDKPYKIRYEIDRGVTSIQTDRKKLKSVLSYLLSNAVKFTPDGEIKLSVLNGSKEAVSFVVSDTGIGMSKDKLPLIFDEFRQLDGSLARRYQGIGLGLTISKKLVELIEGRIEVESELGKGSTFKVVVPIRNE